jgi:hypothetical protein
MTTSHGSSVARKDLQNHPLPELEDSPELGLYERKCQVTESGIRQRIPHPVPHERRPGVSLLEGVVMNPPPVWALQLFIDEFEGRIPSAYPRPPSHRQSAKKNSVVDQRSLPHADRKRRKDSEAERWWR